MNELVEVCCNNCNKKTHYQLRKAIFSRRDDGKDGLFCKWFCIDCNKMITKSFTWDEFEGRRKKG